jgi:hypothetical protein
MFIAACPDAICGGTLDALCLPRCSGIERREEYHAIVFIVVLEVAVIQQLAGKRRLHHKRGACLTGLPLHARPSPVCLAMLEQWRGALLVTLPGHLTAEDRPDCKFVLGDPKGLDRRRA